MPALTVDLIGSNTSTAAMQKSPSVQHQSSVTVSENSIGDGGFDNFQATNSSILSSKTCPGWTILVSKVSNFLFTFKGGEPDGQRLDLAANVQFGSFLDPNPSKPGIVFEVAYSEGVDCAREKAQKLLCTPDEPRPSVVVLFKFREMEASREEYEDMTLEFGGA